jgi:uncharacterized RDD family membrane protein YckC
MDGTRSALIVANEQYTDPGLRRLRAPASDARALARVLADPHIGEFEVRTLINEAAPDVNLAVEEFFSDRRPDDLLLLHFSCHGVKDEDGELYFATANTRLRRLGATAVAADFVNRRMNRTRSRRVVLLLDCCYAGAFERGMTARAGAGVALDSQFGGRGRAVITASNAMEYAFEGDDLTDDQSGQPSVFTSALVAGLETGDADRDQDGMVALDELYDYVYDKVREATPHQTPSKWAFGVQGDLYIARRSRPVTVATPLPLELQQAIENPLAGIRAGAVEELAHLLQGRHAGLALAARQSLEGLAQDDSRTVSTAAERALSTEKHHQPPASPTLRLSTTVVDFGRISQGSTSPEQRIHITNTGGGTWHVRPATSARWLHLSHLDDDLLMSVDTSDVGQHDAAVIIDSDGATAEIHVTAHVYPRPGLDAERRAEDGDHPATDVHAATGEPSPPPTAPLELAEQATAAPNQPPAPSHPVFARDVAGLGHLNNFASWRRRAAAGLIDLLTILPAYVLLAFSGSEYCSSDSSCQSIAPGWLAWIGVLIFAGIKIYSRWYLQGITGQSWGKRACGLRLVSVKDGRPIGFGSAFRRGLAHLIDMITLGVGYLYPIWDPRKQTIADKMNKTIVISE